MDKFQSISRPTPPPPPPPNAVIPVVPTTKNRVSATAVNNSNIGPSKRDICPKRGQVPFVEPRGGKLRFCLPKKKGTCPRPFSCQMSILLRKFICCGKPKISQMKSMVGGVEVEEAEEGIDEAEERGLLSAELRGANAGSMPPPPPTPAPPLISTQLVTQPTPPPFPNRARPRQPSSLVRRDMICERGIPLLIGGQPQTVWDFFCLNFLASSAFSVHQRFAPPTTIVSSPKRPRIIIAAQRPTLVLLFLCIIPKLPPYFQHCPVRMAVLVAMPFCFPPRASQCLAQMLVLTIRAQTITTV